MREPSGSDGTVPPQPDLPIAMAVHQGRAEVEEAAWLDGLFSNLEISEEDHVLEADDTEGEVPNDLMRQDWWLTMPREHRKDLIEKAQYMERVAKNWKPYSKIWTYTLSMSINRRALLNLAVTDLDFSTIATRATRVMGWTDSDRLGILLNELALWKNWKDRHTAWNLLSKING